ncbi:hypothetical protein ACFOZ1_00640 [Gracilibacillus marinus]|uniref:Uncharacterized protein n=1 Tax=Gracilibacillus marinus TaxID=630535 RepID=A0ABV8VPC4_9BACI
MSKSLQAFFKTESEAESFKSQLHKVQANDVRVDRLPEADKTLFLTPLTYSGSSSTGTGMGGGMVAAFTSDTDATVEDGPREYIVEFTVTDEDFEESLKLIMENDGYLDKETITW